MSSVAPRADMFFKRVVSYEKYDRELTFGSTLSSKERDNMRYMLYIIFSEIFGPFAPMRTQAAIMLNNFAVSYGKQEKYHEERILMSSALEICKSEYDPDFKVISLIQKNFATLYGMRNTSECTADCRVYFAYATNGLIIK